MGRWTYYSVAYGKSAQSFWYLMKFAQMSGVVSHLLKIFRHGLDVDIDSGAELVAAVSVRHKTGLDDRP